ncbi:MAG: radical SAM protein [Sphingobacteriia bacterium]|jgi:radical SAM protein with 4Fe4S-binding SPASM domain|nr:radical SAM protein [Sphingobacteriia bacterium]
MEKKLDILALSFTNRCNLSCTHCGYDNLNRNQKDEVGVDFFEGLLAEGKKMGVTGVNITGGEIFIRPDCEQLIQSACEMGFYVTLESNGTLIKDRQLDFLKSLGDSIRVAISLDGLTSEVHDSIRGLGAFDKTKRVVEKLSKLSIPARINTVMQKSNLTQIMSIAEYAVDELGIGFRLLPFILEYGKGACACKTSGVPYNEMKKVLEDGFYPFIRKRNHPQNITVGLNMALVPMDIEGHLICPWGKSMLGVGPTGIASLCHVSNNNDMFVFGDLKEISLEKVWLESKKLEKFRTFDPDTLKGICGNCLARTVCRGGCRLNAFSAYGDFLAPDSQCQLVYDLGFFPEYAVEESEKITSYP